MWHVSVSVLVTRETTREEWAKEQMFKDSIQTLTPPTPTPRFQSSPQKKTLLSVQMFPMNLSDIHTSADKLQRRRGNASIGCCVVIRCSCDHEIRT